MDKAKDYLKIAFGRFYITLLFFYHMQKKVIAVHDGKFHADEVFAMAMMRKIYPGMKVVRTRDPKKLAKADMRFDVGGRYDPKTNDFDHHQSSFNLKRKNRVPYSSCGLAWKHFGRKLVNSDGAWNFMENNFVEFIDADDNGVEYSNGKVRVYSIAEAIMSFNSTWESSKSQDESFLEAVRYAEKILDNELERANLIRKGNKIVEAAVKKSPGGYVFLPNGGLPKDALYKAKSIKFYIMPMDDGNWASRALSVKEGSFECKAYFPHDWAGLSGEELETVSGVKGAVFCHKANFMIVARTKEAIVQMVELALKEAKRR